MQLINATLIRHQERQRESRKEREQRGGAEVGNSIKGQQYLVGVRRETKLGASSTRTWAKESTLSGQLKIHVHTDCVFK